MPLGILSVENQCSVQFPSICASALTFHCPLMIPPVLTLVRAVSSSPRFAPTLTGLEATTDQPMLQDGLEICSRKYQYEKYTPSSSTPDVWRDPSQALDIVITGEVGLRRFSSFSYANTQQTLLAHEQAWGGYKFAGRIRRDGQIIMKRQPVRTPLLVTPSTRIDFYQYQKNASDDSLGTWVFEGHLRFGAAFVGRWRSSTSDNCGIQGIFSMHRTSVTW